MPFRRNMQNKGEEKTIEGGRRNPHTRRWECTAMNSSCSCKVCNGNVKDHCTHSYKNKGELQHHINGHHGMGTGLQCKYRCSNQVYQNMSNLRRHQNTCSKGSPLGGLQCPECATVHARKDNFKRHLINIHQMAHEQFDEVFARARAGPRESSAATVHNAATSDMHNDAFLDPMDNIMSNCLAHPLNITSDVGENSLLGIRASQSSVRPTKLVHNAAMDVGMGIGSHPLAYSNLGGSVIDTGDHFEVPDISLRSMLLRAGHGQSIDGIPQTTSSDYIMMPSKEADDVVARAARIGYHYADEVNPSPSQAQSGQSHDDEDFDFSALRKWIWC